MFSHLNLSSGCWKIKNSMKKLSVSSDKENSTTNMSGVLPSSTMTCQLSDKSSICRVILHHSNLKFSNISHTTQLEPINLPTKQNQPSEMFNSNKPTLNFWQILLCIFLNLHLLLFLLPISWFYRIDLDKLKKWSTQLLINIPINIKFKLITWDVSWICLWILITSHLLDKLWQNTKNTLLSLGLNCSIRLEKHLKLRINSLLIWVRIKNWKNSKLKLSNKINNSKSSNQLTQQSEYNSSKSISIWCSHNSPSLIEDSGIPLSNHPLSKLLKEVKKPNKSSSKDQIIPTSPTLPLRSPRPDKDCHPRKYLHSPGPTPTWKWK